MKKIIITVIAIIFSIYTTHSFAQIAELKVMCWNIKAFEGDDNDPATRYVLKNYVDFVKKHNPDIICVQELESHTGRQGSRDLLSEFAHQLGMHTHFGFSYIADPATNGLYGNGILSKYPILTSFSEPLPKQSYQSDPRCLHVVNILIPVEGSAEGKMIRVINTHYDHNGLVDNMTNSLNKKYFTDSEIPTLYMGDFNTPPTSTWFNRYIFPVFELFDPGYNPDAPTGQNLGHSWGDRTRLDYIFGHPKGAWTKTAFMIDYNHNNLSDHYPIIVTFKLN